MKTKTLEIKVDTEVWGTLTVKETPFILIDDTILVLLRLVMALIWNVRKEAITIEVKVT